MDGTGKMRVDRFKRFGRVERSNNDEIVKTNKAGLEGNWEGVDQRRRERKLLENIWKRAVRKLLGMVEGRLVENIHNQLTQFT